MVDEDVEVYARELVKLAKKAFQEVAEETRSAGLRREIREKMATVDSNRFDECLSTAKRIEKFLNETKSSLCLSDEEINALSAMPSRSQKSVKSMSVQTSDDVEPEVPKTNNRSEYQPKPNLRCYRCGKIGHIVSNCVEKVVVCKTCGRSVPVGKSCSCLKASAPM